MSENAKTPKKNSETMDKENKTVKAKRKDPALAFTVFEAGDKELIVDPKRSSIERVFQTIKISGSVDLKTSKGNFKEFAKLKQASELKGKKDKKASGERGE